jgi:hypothetical protein
MQQVDRGAVLAVQLLEGPIERMHAPLTPSEATVARERAFTLFYRAYDELRRAVTFLRWHDGDIEQLVPTLFLRSGKRKGEAASDGKPADSKRGADSKAGDSKNVTATAGQDDNDGADQSGNATATSVPVGHPGGNPFI